MKASTRKAIIVTTAGLAAGASVTAGAVALADLTGPAPYGSSPDEVRVTCGLAGYADFYYGLGSSGVESAEFFDLAHLVAELEETLGYAGQCADWSPTGSEAEALAMELKAEIEAMIADIQAGKPIAESTRRHVEELGDQLQEESDGAFLMDEFE